MGISSVKCDGLLVLVYCAHARVCLFPEFVISKELSYHNEQKFQDAQLYIARHMAIIVTWKTYMLWKISLAFCDPVCSSSQKLAEEYLQVGISWCEKLSEFILIIE